MSRHLDLGWFRHRLVLGQGIRPGVSYWIAVVMGGNKVGLFRFHGHGAPSDPQWHAIAHKLWTEYPAEFQRDPLEVLGELLSLDRAFTLDGVNRAGQPYPSLRIFEGPTPR